MTDEATGIEQPTEGWDWAVVEIMGHRTHAGRIREEERFGSKMLRVDVPNEGDPAKGWTTHFYGASAIFGLRYSDEATVMKANKPYVSPYRLTYDATGDIDANGDTSQDDDEPF
jgi:hypothetical protein